MTLNDTRFDGGSLFLEMREHVLRCWHPGGDADNAAQCRACTKGLVENRPWSGSYRTSPRMMHEGARRCPKSEDIKPRLEVNERRTQMYTASVATVSIGTYILTLLDSYSRGTRR